MSTKSLVLYADDDIDDRDIFKEAMLAHTDLELHLFSAGDQLIKFLKENFDDVCYIVLDQNMPLMTGMETLGRIKKEYKPFSIPVTIYSTNAYAISGHLSEALGATFMQKPSSYKEITESVSQIAEACRASRRKLLLDKVNKK